MGSLDGACRVTLRLIGGLNTMSGLMSDDPGARIAVRPISDKRINSRIHDERFFLARRSGKRERRCPGRHREVSLSRHEASAAVRTACGAVRGGLVRKRKCKRKRCGYCAGFGCACRFRDGAGGNRRFGRQSETVIGGHDGIRRGRGLWRSSAETGVASASGLCCVGGIGGIGGFAGFRRFNGHGLGAGRRVRSRAAHVAGASQTHARTGR